MRIIDWISDVCSSDLNSPTGIDMTHLQSLRDIGQSLWLDNITREILDDGTLQRSIDEYGITGLTSNPTIFYQAIGDSSAYDAGIREKAAAGTRDKRLFVELALEDLRRARSAEHTSELQSLMRITYAV